MSILETKDVSMRFQGLVAVDKLCLKVEAGEVFSVIGPNGAGKTTAFNAITGVYTPTEGEVFACGKPTCLPRTPGRLISFALLSFASAFFFVCLINMQTLWESSINQNYIFEEDFPWAKAYADLWSTLFNLPTSSGLFPLIAAFIIAFFGILSVWNRSSRRADVVCKCGLARTFQNIRLFGQMTALENVLVGMDQHLKTRFWHAAFRLPLYFKEKQSSEAEASRLLEFVELQGFEQTQARHLSYGHQRRLEIARALATKPKVLLLDEPAAGTNPTESMELMELIRKIKEQGITVLLIEHHMRVVMAISDRIAVLDYGHKIAEGTPEEIRANPKVIEAYLGASV